MSSVWQNFRYCLLGVASLGHVAYAASGVTLVADPPLGGCAQKYLEVALRSELPQGRGVVHVTSLQNLEHSLRAMGAPEDVIQRSAGYIQELFASGYAENPALRDTLRALNQSGMRRQDLMVCLIEPGAHCAKFNGARLIELNQTFEVVSFTTDSWQAAAKRAYRRWAFPANLESPLPRAMLLRGNDVGGIEWYASFFHEAGHFADLQLVSRWLEANVKLMKEQGLAATDRLFQTHVRLKGGRVEVDEAFIRSFLESRGPQIGVEALIWTLKKNMPGFTPQMEAELQAIARGEAMSSLRNRKGQPYDLVRAEGIQESNVFEVGARWAQTMRQTIEQSARPASHQALTVLDAGEYTLLKEMTAPEMSADFRPRHLGQVGGGKPVEFGDALLLPSHIRSVRSALDAEGGQFFMSSSNTIRGRLTGRGGSSGAGSYFIVTTDGVPHIGIEFDSTPGTVRGLMSYFDAWRERRNRLVTEGLPRAEAGVRAFIESMSPVLTYQTRQDAVRAMMGDLGQGYMRELKIAYERRSLREEAAEELIMNATFAPLSAAIKAIRLNGTIAAKLPGATASDLQTLRGLEAKFSHMLPPLIDEALIKMYLIESRVRRPIALPSPARRALPIPGPKDGKPINEPAHHSERETRQEELFSKLVYNFGQRLDDEYNTGGQLLNLIVERDRILRATMGFDRPGDQSPRALLEAYRDRAQARALPGAASP